MGRRGGGHVNLELGGRVAWVLGASSGLGFAAASSLAREGASVALSARTVPPLDAAAESIREGGGRAVAVALDVTDAPAIATAHDRVVEELGPVDVVFVNSGGPPPARFEDLGEPELYGAFELLVGSAWRITKAVLPAMLDKGRGCIVFNTSWAVKEVIDNLLLSNMMRASVTAMAKTLSRELGPRGVRVVVVAPGRFDTPRLRELDEANAAATGLPLDEVVATSHRSIPLQRYGHPAELGDLVAFLASDRASYLTGITVLADGGMLRGVFS